MFAAIQTTLLLTVALEVAANVEVINNSERTKVSRYISSLVAQQNSFDLSQHHDVAMIQLEKSPKSAVFQEILGEILEFNPYNPVYTHISSEAIPPFKVHAVSFFIVTTDSLTAPDNVSFSNISLL